MEVQGGDGLLLSDEDNVYGNDVIPRTTFVSSGGRKTWIMHQKPLPAGKLEFFYSYVHNNLGTESTYELLKLQIWQPVDNTRDTYRLKWEAEISVHPSHPIGLYYFVS